MNLSYKESSSVSEENLKKTFEIIEDYRKRLQGIADEGGYSEPESSINLPFDDSIEMSASTVVAQKRQNGLKYVVVVGIGGSNLGTKAVYDALYGHFDNVEPDRLPRMLFLDTSNASFLKRSFSHLNRFISDPQEIVINVVSKSGATTETMANMEFLVDALEKHLPEVTNRIVATTDEGSPLWEVAKKKDWSRLPIPKQVGGRYSVLSSVGVFPLLLMGINVGELLAGAREMRSKCLLGYPDNPAILSAAILEHHYRNGKVINDNFLGNGELESMGKWYRQLMGESIGKEKDVSGNTVNIGITPNVSVGSTDLHSVGQLYLGGPKDKVTTFIESPHGGLSVPSDRHFPELVSMIDGKNVGDIMNAIFEGVKTAYRKSDLPYMEIFLPKIEEHELGQFMQFKMMEMMYLGKLLNVNAFDQPNVESYKEETRKLLEKN